MCKNDKMQLNFGFGCNFPPQRNPGDAPPQQNGFSVVKCGKCKVHLCLNKNRNGLAAYHGR